MFLKPLPFTGKGFFVVTLGFEVSVNSKTSAALQSQIYK